MIKKSKPILTALVGIGLLVVIILYLMSSRVEDSKQTNDAISNYQECIEAGYPSLESYPAQCRTLDGQSFTENIGNELELTDEIRSENPRPNQTISSPLEIKGEARGNWFFEASFPASLIDAHGKELAVIPVTAQEEWMTIDFVRYIGTMAFPTPQTSTGTLVLKRDNASGLPEHDREMRIPVMFSQSNQHSTETMTVKVFFNNSLFGAECEKTVAVNREVNLTPAIARAALDELLKGTTQAEKTKGYSTLINSGVKINKLNIQNGVASVDFNTELERNSGGSCRALGIRAQITQTLMQFPTVNEVVISVDDRTGDALQP